MSGLGATVSSTVSRALDDRHTSCGWVLWTVRRHVRQQACYYESAVLRLDPARRLPVFAPDDDLYARLMTLNRDAFSDDCYATAYHTLAAALQRAMHLDDPSLMQAVQEVAAA